MKYYHGSVYGSGIVPNSDNLVHIATYDATTQQGHLYQYLINPASGILDETTSYDYSIPGRVKDMAWKFSMQYRNNVITNKTKNNEEQSLF